MRFRRDDDIFPFRFENSARLSKGEAFLVFRVAIGSSRIKELHTAFICLFKKIRRNLHRISLNRQRTKTILREKQQRCDRVGDCGERIVIERERKRLAGTPYELAVNGNASEDLTAGFDVLSFTTEGVPIYIEVKTTVLGKDEDFFISRGELEFAQRCKERGLQYQLHRVYNLNEDTGDCAVVVFTADELLRSFELIPVSYKVRRCGV